MNLFKRLFGFLLVIVGIAAAIVWVFQEGPHYESSQGAGGLGGDLIEQGKLLWEPETGFASHAVITQIITLALIVFGSVLIMRMQED